MRTSSLLQRTVILILLLGSLSICATDDKTLTRSFIEGDFDGDGSKDLFAAVQPGKKVDSNDKSKPPFIYQEVIDSVSPGSVALDLRLGRRRSAAGFER